MINTNPLKWWLEKVINWVFWFFRYRNLESRPKPGRLPRCRQGHISVRWEDGGWKKVCDCNDYSKWV